MKNIQRLSTQKGVTTVEYAMLAAGIAVVIGAIVSGDNSSFTNLVNGLFTNITTTLGVGGADAG